MEDAFCMGIVDILSILQARIVEASSLMTGNAKQDLNVTQEVDVLGAQLAIHERHGDNQQGQRFVFGVKFEPVRSPSAKNAPYGINGFKMYVAETEDPNTRTPNYDEDPIRTINRDDPGVLKDARDFLIACADAILREREMGRFMTPETLAGLKLNTLKM